MHIESDHIGIFEVTLSAYELSTLISTARWVSNGKKGEMTSEAQHQLEKVLQGYDAAIESHRLNTKMAKNS